MTFRADEEARSAATPWPPDAKGQPLADRFDKFTERARRVLNYAQEEAQRFQHNYIGTEHLLLGLIREGEGVAAGVLTNLGAELVKIRSAVEFIIGRGDAPVMDAIGLTPRSKQVIELAVDEARRLNHHYIGTEHLLLGIVREGEGMAAGVLESLGVTLARVREETARILSESMPQRPQGSAATGPRLTAQSTLEFTQRDPLVRGFGASAVSGGLLTPAAWALLRHAIALADVDRPATIADIVRALVRTDDHADRLRAQGIDPQALERAARALESPPDKPQESEPR